MWFWIRLLDSETSQDYWFWIYLGGIWLDDDPDSESWSNLWSWSRFSLDPEYWYRII